MYDFWQCGFHASAFASRENDCQWSCHMWVRPCLDRCHL
jgi:hypothetical protein